MMLKIIESLSSLGMRQGKKTQEAASILKKTLDENKITYEVNSFVAELPETNAELYCDNKKIECKSSSLVEGFIDNKNSIISSLIPSKYNLTQPNINFNPHSEAISRSNFYFAPSISIKRNDVQKVLLAKSIKGEVSLKKYSTELEHLLVGNTKNPENLIFAHYDSIENGSIDNASGVAVAMHLLINYPELLINTLFIFDPQEELSFDQPTYWGRGFRVFEEKFLRLLEKSEKIIVIDSVGNGSTVISQDKNDVYLSFPIKGIDNYAHKTFTAYSDINDLMTVYHSQMDMPRKINEKYLMETVSKLHSLLELKSSL